MENYGIYIGYEDREPESRGPVMALDAVSPADAVMGFVLSRKCMQWLHSHAEGPHAVIEAHGERGGAYAFMLGHGGYEVHCLADEPDAVVVIPSRLVGCDSGD